MAKKSRAVTPLGAPYRWQPYRTKTDRVFENELEACLQERCTSQEQYDIFRGEVEARIEMAEQGRLGDPDAPAPDPVVTQPELWEIRFDFDAKRKLRAYHAEPTSHPRLLLGLKVHWKALTAPDGRRLSNAEIEDLQNGEMAEAARRFGAFQRTPLVDGEPGTGKPA